MTTDVGAGMSDQARNEEAVRFAREALAEFGDPREGMEPDGYCEAAAAAVTLRQLLAILEPEAWCPPHSYSGQSTMVRGECLLTCEICGDAFVGKWDQEGTHARPADADAPCPACKGTGWSGSVPWAWPHESPPTGRPCPVCGGSSVSPPDPARAQAVAERSEQQAAKARAMGFVVTEDSR